MAYAAYREMLGATLVRLPASQRPSQAGPQWVVLDITVHSCDALRARRALVDCPDTAVLRCIPLVDDKRVRLEIRLEEHMADEVMHRVMACLPDGEIGHLTTWRQHMQRHGLTHGF